MSRSMTFVGRFGSLYKDYRLRLYYWGERASEVPAEPETAWLGGPGAARCWST